MEKIEPWEEDLQDDGLLLADGFEEAYIGNIERCGMLPVACYDVEKCLEILMNQGMDREEAEEFFNFNVLGSYVGPRTPYFLYKKKS